MQRLRRSPYAVLFAAFLCGLLILALDFLVDMFVFFEGKTVIEVLVKNLGPAALWSNGLILLSYAGFGVILYVLRRATRDEADRVDGFLLQLLEHLKSLRFNLYSIKMAVHVARYDIEPPQEALALTEQRIDSSVSLIDAYLSGQGQTQAQDKPPEAG
jgi:hypothetical protein